MVIINSVINSRLPLSQPPFSHRRYDFFKARIQDYDSPDPRGTQSFLDINRQTKNVSNEASKFLNFDDEESAEKATEDVEVDPEAEDAFKDFHELEQRSSLTENVKKPKIINAAEEEMCASQGPAAYVAPFESEALVEWKDNNRPEQILNTENDCVVVQSPMSKSKNVSRISNPIFAFNSFDEKVN